MPSTLVRFGEFELDPGKYELLREGQPVKLERLPMELLILLVESRGTLVTREMIIEHLWGKDVYREAERGINTAINKLRSVLCDDPRQPRYLQTIIGKGYRFIAEVQIDTSEEPPPPPVAISTAVKLDSNSAQLLVSSEPSILDMGQLDAPDAEPPTTQLPLPAQQTVAESEAQNSNRRKFQLALLAVVAVALGLTLGYFLVGRGARRVPEKVQWIAVLPLLNLSQDSEQDYLVDGMTDQLITDLARASPLRVISR